jgi:hypothetical protein
MPDLKNFPAARSAASAVPMALAPYEMRDRRVMGSVEMSRTTCISSCVKYRGWPFGFDQLVAQSAVRQPFGKHPIGMPRQQLGEKAVRPVDDLGVRLSAEQELRDLAAEVLGRGLIVVRRPLQHVREVGDAAAHVVGGAAADAIFAAVVPVLVGERRQRGEVVRDRRHAAVHRRQRHREIRRDIHAGGESEATHASGMSSPAKNADV